MTTVQKIGWGLLGIAALWYGVLRGVDAVKVTFERLRVLSVNVGSITFNLSVLVHNPLLIDVLVNDIVGEVSLMNIPCAMVNYPVNQRLHAGKTSRLQVNFDVFSKELGEALFANIQTGNINTLLMRFDGYITVKGIQIPINREFTFNDIFGK